MTEHTRPLLSRPAFSDAPESADQHEEVARNLEWVAASYDARALPFRTLAEKHRAAARSLRGETFGDVREYIEGGAAS